MIRSLRGRRVLLTRGVEDNALWAAGLEAVGAAALEFPCLEPRLLEGAANAAKNALGECDWIALAAPRAVEALNFFCPPPWSNTPRIACVGAVTATRSKELLGPVALTASEGTGECLARELHSRCEGEEIIFLPAARDGGRAFEEVFAGRQLLRVALYETLAGGPPAKAPACDAIFFASPSAVRGFCLRAGQIPKDTLAVALGPTTEAALTALGHPLVATARSRDLDGLLRAASEHGHLSSTS